MARLLSSLRALPQDIAPVGRAPIGYLLLLLALLASILVAIPVDAPLASVIESPRRLAVALFMGLLGARYLWTHATRRAIIYHPSPLDWPILGFMSIALLSGLLSPYARLSIWGALWNQDALPFWGLGLAGYLGVRLFCPSPRLVHACLLSLLVVGGLVSLLGFLDYFCGWSLNPHFSRTRLVSTLGNPMFTGTFLAMVAPLGVALLIAGPARYRTLAGLCTPLIGVALLLTQTRGAWVGGAVAFGLVLILGRRHPVPRSVWISILMTVCGLGLLIGVHPTLRVRLHSLVTLQGITVTNRLFAMQGTLAVAQVRPIIGWGVGVAKYVFPQYRPPTTTGENGLPFNRGYTTAAPHNLTVQLMAEVGFIGLGAYLWLVWTAGCICWRLQAVSGTRQWMGLGLLGVLAAYLTANQFGFDNMTTLLVCWVALGLAANLSVERRPRVLLPIAARSAGYLRVASGVFVGLTLLTTAGQLWAAVACGQAIQALEHASRLPVAEAQVYWRRATTYAHRLAILTPSYDPAHYRLQVQALHAEAMATADPEAANTLRRRLFPLGEAGLRRSDRDPVLLRFLADDYLACNQTAAALRIAQRLIIVEPQSSEAHLHIARALEAQGRLSAAEAHAFHASRLDPTSSHPWYALAHYQCRQLGAGDPRGIDLAEATCDNFARGLRRDPQALTPALRVEYVIALVLANDAEEAIRTGRSVSASPERDELAQILSTLGSSHPTAARVRAALFSGRSR
jgi:O-antigen polymerase